MFTLFEQSLENDSTYLKTVNELTRKEDLMINLFKILFENLSEKSSRNYSENGKLKRLLGLGLIRSRKPITIRKRERMIRFLTSL